jgi:hypothetical protein
VRGWEPSEAALPGTSHGLNGGASWAVEPGAVGENSSSGVKQKRSSVESASEAFTPLHLVVGRRAEMGDGGPTEGASEASDSGVYVETGEEPKCREEDEAMPIEVGASHGIGGAKCAASSEHGSGGEGRWPLRRRRGGGGAARPSRRPCGAQSRRRRG